MRIACERSATSYIEGENVAIKYRWAENQRKRLPALAAELVRRQVASIGLTSATLSNSCTKIRYGSVFLGQPDVLFIDRNKSVNGW